MQKKIVFVDLDGTLIETKSGRTFPTNYKDWKLKPNIISYVKGYRDKGYLVILVTNQGGIERGLVDVNEFSQKLEDVQKASGIIFDKIYVADRMTSLFRKPLSNALVKDLKKGGIEVDKSNSLMIGDAGGRATDFSDSDFIFAKGLGISFTHAKDI